MPRAEIARKATKRKQVNFMPSSKGGGKSIMTTVSNICESSESTHRTTLTCCGIARTGRERDSREFIAGEYVPLDCAACSCSGADSVLIAPYKKISVVHSNRLRHAYLQHTWLKGCRASQMQQKTNRHIICVSVCVGSYRAREQ